MRGMASTAMRVAVCMPTYSETRYAPVSDAGSSFCNERSRQSTSNFSRFNQAADSASANGWRPSSYGLISTTLNSAFELTAPSRRGAFDPQTSVQLSISRLLSFRLLLESAGGG